MLKSVFIAIFALRCKSSSLPLDLCWRPPFMPLWTQDMETDIKASKIDLKDEILFSGTSGRSSVSADMHWNGRLVFSWRSWSEFSEFWGHAFDYRQLYGTCVQARKAVGWVVVTDLSGLGFHHLLILLSLGYSYYLLQRIILPKV